MAIYQRKKITYKSNGKKKTKYIRRKQPVKGDPWYIDYYDVNGKRQREKIGPNKRLAENVLMKRKVEAAENKNLDINKIKKIKFFDFSDEYLEVYSKNNKKSYKTDIGRSRSLKKIIGNKYLHQITPLVIEKYKRKRMQGVTKTTVNHDLKLLRAMFNKAIAWGKAKSNPVNKVDFFKVNNSRWRYLEEDEIRRLVEASAPHLRPVVVTAVNTGIRKSNILNLKWDDLDFSQDFIHIKESKNNEGRDIPMNKNLKICLKNLKDKRNPAGSEYVFLNSNGDRYRDTRRAFKQAKAKAGITNFRFHDLRHTAASQMVMRGVDLATIRKILGHKSIQMTLRYSHLSPKHKRDAVEKLDEILLESSQNMDKQKKSA